MIEVTALCPKENKNNEVYNDCITQKPLMLLLFQINQPHVEIKEIAVKIQEEESIEEDIGILNIAAFEDKKQ